MSNWTKTYLLKSAAICIAFLCIFYLVTSAQETFQSTVQTTYYRTAMEEIMPLNDGGFYTKQVLLDPTWTYKGVQVTKFNACHNKVWSRVIEKDVANSGSTIAQNHALTVLSDNSIIVSTMTVASFSKATFGGVWPLLCKIDTDGNLEWSKIVYVDLPANGYSGNWASSCVATPNGGFALAFSGNSTVSSLGAYVLLMKFKSDGSLILNERMDYNNIGGNPNLADILKMPDNGFCIINENGLSGASYQLPSIIRIDSAGRFLWMKVIKPPAVFASSNFEIRGCVSDSKGNIYATGSFYNSAYPYGVNTSFIFKLDTSGNPVWFQMLNRGQTLKQDVFTRMAINHDDHIAVMMNLNNKDNYFTEFDTSGQLLLAKHLKNQYPFIDYYSTFTYTRPAIETVDSAFMFIEKYYATDVSVLSRFDKKGKSSCFDTDTSLDFNNFSFTSKAHILNLYSGFKIKDTSLSLTNLFIKQTMLCDAHIYPVADLGNDTVLCVDSFTLFSGPQNAGCKYLWSTGDTTPNLIVYKTGTYWIKITGDFCTSSDTVNVYLLGKIKTGLIKKPTICPHDSVLLQVIDTTIPGFYWVTPKKDSKGNQVVVKGNSVWASDSGYYYLKQNSAHCRDVDSVKVSFFPPSTLHHDTVICSGTTDTLFAGKSTSAASHLWNTGDTGSFTIIHKTGKYWLKLSYGSCVSTDSINVIFVDEIKDSLIKKHFICPYDSVLIGINAKLPGFDWITPQNKVVTGNSIVARDSGNYILILNGTKSCTNADTVHVTVYKLPAATAGPDTTLCYNETYTMQGAGGITYLWTPAKYLSNDTIANPQAMLPNTQLYTLYVRNQQGCEDSADVLLKVRPKPAVIISRAQSPVCYGSPLVLHAKGTGGDSLHYYFTWPNDSASGDTISRKIFASGWHKVILKDNCSPQSAADSIFINVIPKPIADFSILNGKPYKINTLNHFQNLSKNSISYLWTFGDSTASSIEINPTHIYTDSNEYKITLVAYSPGGCFTDTAYAIIHVIGELVDIYIPDAFTPDGNGINDFFDISGVGIASYKYGIYNRWGENIFNSTVTTHGWDGTFRGQPVMEGVYIYQLDVTDITGRHHYLSGNITLMR